MPHRPALRADRTMPRQIRAARFFWKMPRYTTSHVKCAIAPPQSLNQPQAPNLNQLQGLVPNGYLMVQWSDQTMPPRRGRVNCEIGQVDREVPLPGGLPDHRCEVAMDGGVVGQLRVERSDENSALARHHRLALVPHERGDGGADPADPRRPNEHHFDGPRTVAEVGLPFRLEALLLPAVGIAHGRDVDESQRWLLRAFHIARQEDEPGAGAHDGLARSVELLQGRHELPIIEELEQRRALPAGHDETSDLVELPGQPHLDRLDAEPIESFAVEVEVALQGEHADAHGLTRCAPYQPRVWSRSDSLSLEVSIPCMASPKSSETLARMSAS